MEWSDIERAMVVTAHPDDPEYGCAGSLAKLANDGKEVFYVIVTDGSKGSADPEMTPQKLIALRQKEQREATRRAGGRLVEFLGFPDGMLQPTLEVRKAITASIRRYKPDLVICQNPLRDFTISVFAQHPDHLAAGEATLAAIYPCARDRLTFPELLEEGLEPHNVREIWVSGTGVPDYFVDITDTMDTKVQALLAHESQVDVERVTQFVPDRARQTGSDHDMKYAEAFKRLQMP
jgi:LmbE family N-acetylglucosaminyl deacetylase